MKKENREEQINIVNELDKILTRMGWVIALPDSDKIDHIIIGKKKVVENIVSEVVGSYDIMEKKEKNS